MNRDNPKWKIIELSIREPNQIVQINHKLPSYIKQVKGIYVSVKDVLAIPNLSKIYDIGRLSLWFNSRQMHSVYCSVDYSEEPLDKFEPTKLNQSISTHQAITGFYIDKAKTKAESGTFMPYTILIYLQCYA
jgi:hypothetical protein